MKELLCQNWLAGFPDENTLCARMGWRVFLMKTTFVPELVGGVFYRKTLCVKMGWRGFLMKKPLCQNGLVGFSNEKQTAIRSTTEIEPDNF